MISSHICFPEDPAPVDSEEAEYTCWFCYGPFSSDGGSGGKESNRFPVSSPQSSDWGWPFPVVVPYIVIAAPRAFVPNSVFPFFLRAYKPIQETGKVVCKKGPGPYSKDCLNSLVALLANLNRTNPHPGRKIHGIYGNQVVLSGGHAWSGSRSCR